MTRSEWVLVVFFVVVLGIAGVARSLPFLFLPGLVLMATAYFSAVVASAAVDGLEEVGLGDAHSPTGSARQRFWDVVRPRFFRWLGLWLAFYFLLETVLWFAGGFHLILSLSSAGLVAFMVPCGLFSLSWTRSRAGIAGACLGITMVGCVLLWALTYFVVDNLGMGGYMDIGLLTLPPLVTGGVMILLGIRMAIGVWRRDESWYRELI